MYSIQSSTSQEEQLYEYLLMRYSEVHRPTMHGYRNNQLSPQLELSQFLSTYHKLQSILDLCLQHPSSFSQTFYPDSDNNKNTIPDDTLKLNNCILTSQRLVVIRYLVESYPSVFCENVYQGNDKKEGVKGSIEGMLFSVVRRHSVKGIVQCLMSNHEQQRGIMESDGQNEELFLKNVVNTYRVEIDFLLHSIVIHFNLTTHQTINSHLLQSITQTLPQMNFPTPQSQAIITSKLQQLFDFYLRQIFSQPKSPQQIFEQTFLQKYEEFKTRFRTGELDVDRNILEVHQVQEILSISQKLRKDGNNSVLSMNPTPLQLINFFSINKQQHYDIPSQSTHINSTLLTQFLKQPYQTSLFVLYQLLSQSGYKNVDKFFLPLQERGRQQSKVVVDPMVFLLIDTNLIDWMNAQSFSLSLWIVMEVWVGYVQARNDFTRRQPNYQAPTTLPPTTLPITTHNDPRKIYTIKQSSYPHQTPTTTTLPPSLPSTTLQQFQTKYKSPLMYTMAMFLLTLRVETTMLKYFPIQNNLIGEMIEGDMLPTLLLECPFAFGRGGEVCSGNEGEDLKVDGKKVEEDMMRKIEEAQTLEEIEELQTQLHQLTNSKSNVTDSNQSTAFHQQSIFSTHFTPYSLPWLNLIEQKTILFLLLHKPKGLSLALKFIERRPHTFLKLYEHHILKMILFQVQQRSKLHKQGKNGMKKGYRFRGNLNVKMKKSIDYNCCENDGVKSGGNAGKVGNNGRGSNSKEERNDRETFDVMKKIVLIYKKNTADQYTRTLCNVTLDFLANLS